MAFFLLPINTSLVYPHFRGDPGAGWVLQGSSHLGKASGALLLIRDLWHSFKAPLLSWLQGNALTDTRSAQPCSEKIHPQHSPIPAAAFGTPLSAKVATELGDGGHPGVQLCTHQNVRSSNTAQTAPRLTKWGPASLTNISNPFLGQTACRFAAQTLPLNIEKHFPPLSDLCIPLPQLTLQSGRPKHMVMT